MSNVEKLYDIWNFKFERQAFFKASLKLVGQGKFLSTSIEEIAFMARVSSLSLPYIFESRQKLIEDLLQHVLSNIDEIINKAICKADPDKDKFFSVWTSLFDHYVNHPDQIALMMQFDSFITPSSASRQVYPGIGRGLTDLFRSFERNGILCNANAETSAYIFHEHILTTARMQSSKASLAIHFDVSLMPLMLWDSLVNQDHLVMN